jgi:hypothetical protein
LARQEAWSVLFTKRWPRLRFQSAQLSSLIGAGFPSSRLKTREALNLHHQVSPRLKRNRHPLNRNHAATERQAREIKKLGRPSGLPALSLSKGKSPHRKWFLNHCFQIPSRFF